MSHLIYIDESIHSGLEAIRDADDVDDWDLTFVITDERVFVLSLTCELTYRARKRKGRKWS